MAAAYFGILPLVLLVLLGYVSGRYARYKGKRRFLLLIAWSCFGAWILFQVTFALAFKYTPWNGRYMLICWPLSAVALAACIQCIGSLL